MPANYVHVNRPDGTILTPEVYNGDHQNHIDNLVPLQIDDYSVNLGQMQTTTDPGESGTESLATSLGGELERLRFVLKEMKGTTQWYITNLDRIVHLQFVFSNGVDNFPDSVITTATTNWRVPAYYVSGDPTLTLLRNASVSTNTSVMRLTVSRRRAGSASVTLISAANIDFTPGTTNSVQTTHTGIQTGSGFVAGDFLQFQLQRLGADAGDTCTGTVTLDGASITFSAIAGRV